MSWLRDSCYVILLIITSNNIILLSLPIALTYYLVFNSSPFYCISLSFPLSSYCSLDIYSPTSHLLTCNLLWLDFVRDLGFLLKPYNCKVMTKSSFSQLEPWLVVCIITRKRLQSTQSFRPLKLPYGWWDAQLVGHSKYGFMVLGQPDCYEKLTIGLTIDLANEGSDC